MRLEIRLMQSFACVGALRVALTKWAVDFRLEPNPSMVAQCPIRNTRSQRPSFVEKFIYQLQLRKIYI